MRYLDSDYDIYEDGRCYSHKSNKWLTPQMNAKYPTYNLTLKGKKKKIKVHRMVAETFLAKPYNKNIVNHKDGNTHNFHLSNLEWANEKENSQHAIKNNLIPKGDQTPTFFDFNLDTEQWVECYNYPNYNISSCGRVVNKRTGRLLKICIDNKGYPYANFWRQGKGKVHQIHRIEFQSFYPRKDLSNLVINHIDGNKTNNYLNNLEAITRQENNLHAEYQIKTHLCAKPIIQYDENWNLIQEFVSISQAQKITGISNISRAIKKQYLAGGFYWKFKYNN